MTKENALANFLDSQDFYELMQAYRHEPIDAATPFEAVRLALYAAIAQPVEPIELWEQLVSIGQEVDTRPTARNFCQRCGQRLGDADHIHTCSLPTI